MSSVLSIDARRGSASGSAFTRDELLEAVHGFRESVQIVVDPATGRYGVAHGGHQNGLAVLATLPPLYPEWLGDRSFCEIHGLRFPYVTGAMANGIATPAVVVAMARAGMLGFLGTAGLTHRRMSERIDEIETDLRGTGLPWGANLIHSPNEVELERGTVELFLKRGVRRAESSAYMALNPMVVRYAYSGIRRLPDGSIHRRNHLFAKISRPEVARRFMAPAPAEILDGLVSRGELTRDEAELARLLPVAEDVTVEADSGGHTDNQPMVALFPLIIQLRDELCRQHGRPIRVGAAGGLGTPSAVAAAFQLGAAYVLTGSVNQGCVESGLSTMGKQMLTQAGLADVVMAPAADMFELGVQVQVLKRGTMFGVRAQKLYDAYQAYGGMDEIPADERERLEREVFKAPLADVWAETEAFFRERDPKENERAAREPKHKMALVFRWYLGLSSKWAITGDEDRRMDFQIWCGPAMGAFNQWVKGTPLEPASGRTVVQVALNLLEGAATICRAHQLRACGVDVPSEAFQFVPRTMRA